MPKTPMAFTEQEIADLKTALSRYIITLNEWKSAAKRRSEPDDVKDLEAEIERFRALHGTIEYFKRGGE